jgi:hypothetical protein
MPVEKKEKHDKTFNSNTSHPAQPPIPRLLFLPISII